MQLATDSKSRKEKYFSNKIIFLSFVYAVLVVVMHAYNVDNYHLKIGSSTDTFIINLEKLFSMNIAQITVPTFFAISGYWFYRNYSYAKLKEKYISRFKSLVLPYVTWNTIYLLYFFLLSSIPFISQFLSSERVTLNVSSFLQGIFYYKYNEAYWYMFQLILFTALSPLIFLLLKKRISGLFFLAVIFALNIFYVALPVIRLNCLMFYLVGAFAGMYCNDFVISKASRKTIVISGILIVASQILYYWSNSSSVHLPDILIRLPFLCGAFFFIDIIRIPQAKPYMKLSFFLYSVHILILKVYVTLLFIALPRNSVSALISYILSLILTILTIVLLAKLLKKFLNPAYRILNGGR
jgi:peptidoglycan/LPS O-acetylase OafA/YrhL